MSAMVVRLQLETDVAFFGNANNGHRLIDSGNHIVKHSTAFIHRKRKLNALIFQMLGNHCRPIHSAKFLIMPKGEVDGALGLESLG
jgi:hypothetical protein